MGRAARAAGIEFGFLHIISNNLARHLPGRPVQRTAQHRRRTPSPLLDRIHEIIRLRLRTIADAYRRRGIP